MVTQLVDICDVLVCLHSIYCGHRSKLFVCPTSPESGFRVGRMLYPGSGREDVAPFLFSFRKKNPVFNRLPTVDFRQPIG